MYGTDQKSQFIELRAKGWSLRRIAEHLNVPKSTLADWHHQSQDEIAQCQRFEREATQERILICHQHELIRLVNRLGRIEGLLAGRDLSVLSTPALLQQAAATRAEIRKLVTNPIMGSLHPLDPAAPEPPGVTLPPRPEGAPDFGSFPSPGLLPKHLDQLLAASVLASQPPTTL